MVLPLVLVVGAGGDPVGAPDGGDGVRRVEAVGGGGGPGAGHGGAQAPVPVEVVVGEAGARERPGALVPPVAAVEEAAVAVLVAVAGAHDEHPDVGLVLHLGGLPLDEVVEPPEVEVGVEVVHGRLRPELHLAGPGPVILTVVPGADQETDGPLLPRQADVVLDDPPVQDVPPPPDVEHGDVGGLLVVVLPVPADPLVVLRLPLRGLGNDVAFDVRSHGQGA